MYSLNQVSAARPRAPGFLKLFWFMCWYVCVSVCLCICVSVYLCVCASAPEGINNQWHDMVWYTYVRHVWFVKQVSRLCPAFNYFIIWHLPLIKWMGVAILTQHIMNTCQRKLRWCGTSYRQSTSFIKVSGWMRSDKFKRRPVFSFTVTILA